MSVFKKSKRRKNAPRSLWLRGAFGGRMGGCALGEGAANAAGGGAPTENATR